MLVESGKTADGRGYEIRQGKTGGGRVTHVVQFSDGQVFKGTDKKPLSLPEARNHIKSIR